MNHIITGMITIRQRIIFVALIFFVFISLACVSAADNQTTDDATLESDAITEEILMDELPTANFTTLKNDIANEENELKLERNYTYNYDDDHTHVPDGGIRIEKDNFVIDGQGHTINGVGSTRIFLVSAKNVTLKNINFINGHIDGNGGAVYWPGENGKIQNCNFTNNTASNGRGGAIYFNKDWTIENSNFANNRAQYASAIYIEGNAEANISNCRFTNNEAGSYSTIYFNSGKGTVANTYFENNTSTKGSGIYFGSQGIVENCTFANNKLKGDYSWGSAIFFDHGYGWINNCNFTNNSGPVTIEFANYGGTINNSNFDRNHGTIIEFPSRQVGIVLNSNFTNNIGRQCGPVYAIGNATVDNCIFLNNTANNMGAGITVFGSGTVKNSVFINNRVTDSDNGQGGAIKIEGNGIVDNCNFINNSVEALFTPYGGAIYFGSEGYVNNSNFTNNRLNGNRNEDKGGAVFFISSLARIENCIFTDNQANKGGAVFFHNNGTVINCIFNNNTANDGGAIYARYVNYEKRGAVISRCTFTDNSADNGGAIYYTNDPNAGNILIEDSNFTSNRASSNGAVYINCGNATVTGSNFTDNQAESGGAIYFKIDITDCSIENCHFLGNNASADGGALYFKAIENFTIENATFDYNDAAGNGGAIYVLDVCDSTTFRDTLFINNVAETGDGGAINFFRNLTGGTFDNITFTANSAENGGAINANADVVNTTISNSEFKDNIAASGTNNIALNGDGTFKLDNVTPANLGPSYVAHLTIISVTDNVTYGGNVEISVNVTGKLNEPLNGTVSVTVNGENHTANVENGSGKLILAGLDAGKYDLNVAFTGNTYAGVSPVKFNVLKIPNNVKVQVGNVVYGHDAIVTITADVNGRYIVNIGGTIKNIDVVNGTGSAAISLNAGTYLSNTTFDNPNYETNVSEAKFNVSKQNASITAASNAYVINYGGKYSITLKDADGKLLSGKKVTFTLNDKNIGSATTNAKGVATITLTAKILKAAKAGSKNLVIKFTDLNYNTTPKTVKITINKEKTKIAAKNKKFKRSVKVKKYTIALKNSKGKAIKKVKVTLKVKGKKYTAKTNSMGKATFKIKKLTKKGKYKATVKFAGNANYKAVNKKVKITIK